MIYRCFTRTWWVADPKFPGGRRPQAGRRSYRSHPAFGTEQEARDYCQRWNATHNPGPLSRKCEFESATK